MLKLKICKQTPLKLKISSRCPSVEVDAILQTKTCCPSTEEIVIVPDEGFDGIEQVVIQATPLEDTTIRPLTTRQLIRPSEEVIGLSSVEVEPVTNEIDENIIPTNIKEGVTILGVTGVVEEKVPINLQEKRVSASPTNETTVLPNEEYDGLSKVVVNKVTHEIDSDIIPTNIREGVEILGVEGTYKAEPILQDKTVNPSEEGSVVTYDNNYNGLGEVTINPIKSSMISGLRASNIKKDVEILDIVGTYGATSQIKFATPSMQQQIIKPDEGIEYLSQVTIHGVTSAIDSNITPINIRKGINILGTEGTFEGDFNFQDKTVSARTDDFIVTPDAGYDALTSVTVEKVTSSIDSDIIPENIKRGIKILDVEGTYAPDPSMEDKYIYPATYEQNIYPDEGYSYFDKVTIAPVTSSIDSDIIPENIKKGKFILDVEGTLEPVNGEEIYINPSIETQVIIPDSEAGKNAITKVTVNPVTSSIDSNITDSNIKKGISILGVEGTYEGATSLQTKTVTPTIEEQQVTADSEYDALSSVTVEAIQTEDITVDPSIDTTTYNRSDGKFINSVTVNKVTSDIDANIQPENIKQNMSILGVVGTYAGDTEQNYFGALERGGTSDICGIAFAILSLPDDLVISTTNGNYMFSNLYNLTKIPALDFSQIETATYMFQYCYDVTDWSAIKSFSNITNASYMFKYDNLNITFLEGLKVNMFSKTTNMSYCFSYAELPNAESVFNLPVVTTMTRTFEYSESGGTASKVTIIVSQSTIKMDYMAYYTKIPKWEIVVSDETIYPQVDMSNIFNNASGVTELIISDNIRPTSLASAFYSNNSTGSSAPNIKSIELNLSSCTNMASAFYYNKNIVSVQFNGDSQNVTNMSSCFYGAKSGTNSLTTVSGTLNCSKVINVYNMFGYQSNLINLCALTDLGKAYTQKTANYSNYKLDLSACVNLSYESLMNVINGLYDLNISYNVAGGGTLYTQGLVLGTTNKAKLTEEEIAIATNKGWTVS